MRSSFALCVPPRAPDAMYAASIAGRETKIEILLKARVIWSRANIPKAVCRSNLLQNSVARELLHQAPDLRQIEKFARRHHAHGLVPLLIEVPAGRVHGDD